jgi:hypothetical protein
LLEWPEFLYLQVFFMGHMAAHSRNRLLHAAFFLHMVSLEVTSTESTAFLQKQRRHRNGAVVVSARTLDYRQNRARKQRLLKASSNVFEQRGGSFTELVKQVGTEINEALEQSKNTAIRESHQYMSDVMRLKKNLDIFDQHAHQVQGGLRKEHANKVSSLNEKIKDDMGASLSSERVDGSKVSDGGSLVDLGSSVSTNGMLPMMSPGIPISPMSALMMQQVYGQAAYNPAPAVFASRMPSVYNPAQTFLASQVSGPPPTYGIFPPSPLSQRTAGDQETLLGPENGV